MPIPIEDLPIYNALSKRCRALVDEQLRIVEDLAKQRKAKVPGHLTRIAAAAQRLGISTGALRRKVDAYMQENNWQAIIDNRLLGSSAHRKLSPEFVAYWQQLVLDNQRVAANAYVRLCQQWAAGDTIPGLPPAAERKGKLPFEKRTLYNYLPAKAEVLTARHGIAAARKHLPCNLQDVSQVMPLEYVLFDDVELDFLVRIPGYPRPVKLRLLVAMDLCSRLILGYGIRPAITREDGKEDGLKLRDMKAICARILRSYGVPVAYTMHWICERGTAHLPDATKAALATITGGQLTVHDTSMIAAHVFAFRDKATGNSWGKAWLESSFNLLHNTLANGDGQKGRRYDLAPAELATRSRELTTLVRAGQALPIADRLALQYPFRDLEEAVRDLDNALATLHARTDHTLQGFDEIHLWQIHEGDTPKLEREIPEWIITSGAASNLIWSTRLESPRERWDRKIIGVERRPIHPSSLQLLMEEHRRIKYAAMQFAFTFDGTEYVYLPEGSMLPHLREGEHYILWFHPQWMGEVYVTRDRPHCGFLGMLTKFDRIRKGAIEEEKARLARTKHAQNIAIQRVQDRGLHKLAAQADAYEHNARLIEEATRNITAAEVEIEVITAPAQADGAVYPAAAQQLVDAQADRVTRTRKEQSIDLVAETLKSGTPADISPAAAPEATGDDDWL